MKTGLAISIQQPWAWLILRPDVTDPAARAALYVTGQIKPIENRDWPTKIRGTIGIHAGLKFDAMGLAWVRHEFPQIELPAPHAFECGGIVGRARLTDCVEDHDSPWFFGRYGFVFDDAEPLPFRPCRGKLGFFRPDMEAQSAI